MTLRCKYCHEWFVSEVILHSLTNSKLLEITEYDSSETDSSGSDSRRLLELSRLRCQTFLLCGLASLLHLLTHLPDSRQSNNWRGTLSTLVNLSWWMLSSYGPDGRFFKLIHGLKSPLFRTTHCPYFFSILRGFCGLMRHRLNSTKQ